jgi:hypothetical protein
MVQHYILRRTKIKYRLEGWGCEKYNFRKIKDIDMNMLLVYFKIRY